MIIPKPEKTLRWRTGLLAGLFLLAACGEDSRRVQAEVGAQLPAVILTGLTDEAPASTGALRGTALIINFWATWCEPCRREMPSLERLSHRLAAHGVRVIGVSIDADLNLAREFVRAYQLTFPMYADGDKKAFQSALRVNALPQTMLVTADGTIAARITGTRDWDSAEAKRLVEQALNLRNKGVR